MAKKTTKSAPKKSSKKIKADMACLTCNSTGLIDSNTICSTCQGTGIVK